MTRHALLRTLWPPLPIWHQPNVYTYLLPSSASPRKRRAASCYLRTCASANCGLCAHQRNAPSGTFVAMKVSGFPQLRCKALLPPVGRRGVVRGRGAVAVHAVLDTITAPEVDDPQAMVNDEDFCGALGAPSSPKLFSCQIALPDKSTLRCSRTAPPLQSPCVNSVRIEHPAPGVSTVSDSLTDYGVSAYLEV